MRNTVLFLTLMGFPCMIAAQAVNPTPAPVVHSLEACIYDLETLQLIPNAELRMVGVGHGLQFFQQLDTSCIRATLPDSRYISVRASASNYMTINDQIVLDTISDSTYFLKEYYLTPAKVRIGCGPPIVLFAESSAQFTTEADSVLNEVYLMMIDNPTMVIEVRGHSDTQEAPKLAETRSHSVRDYLVAKGVKRNRIQPVAKGASEPLITSNEIRKMANEEERERAHSMNRRVEFKAIGFDAEP
jgi:outer membrane protein OmpA-like peptidoglycan-associated protein